MLRGSLSPQAGQMTGNGMRCMLHRSTQSIIASPDGSRLDSRRTKGRMRIQPAGPFAGTTMDRPRESGEARRYQDEEALGEPAPEGFEQTPCRSARGREGTRVEGKCPLPRHRSSAPLLQVYSGMSRSGTSSRRKVSFVSYNVVAQVFRQCISRILGAGCFVWPRSRVKSTSLSAFPRFVLFVACLARPE